MDNADTANGLDRIAELRTGRLRLLERLKDELGHDPAAAPSPQESPPPSVAQLLAIDGLYRELAATGALAGTTLDRVVIVYEDARGEGRCTVVTERRGVLSGLRVVRGREAECRRFHARSLAQIRRQLRAER
jgi:hypothetical protein